MADAWSDRIVGAILDLALAQALQNCSVRTSTTCLNRAVIHRGVMADIAIGAREMEVRNRWAM